MIEWYASSSAQHPAILPLFYLFSQMILLCIYFNQDFLYTFLAQLQQKSKWLTFPILQLHSFVTALSYIVQWTTMWTWLDYYTPNDYLIILFIGIIAILSIRVITGHLCDLVCSPFIISYDSIEYNIRIGTLFNREIMNSYVSNLINYLIYEHAISLLSILAWRGIYTFLDVYLYPDNVNISAGSSILIGYILYFPLMYLQSSVNNLGLKINFIKGNCPHLFSNLHQFCAFMSCLFLWRGFWMLFDAYIATISFVEASPYLCYTIGLISSFLFLSLLRTASSINGPMSQIPDKYDLFPLYSNCFLVQLFDRKAKILDDDDKSLSNRSEISTIESSTGTLF